MTMTEQILQERIDAAVEHIVKLLDKVHESRVPAFELGGIMDILTERKSDEEVPEPENEDVFYTVTKKTPGCPDEYYNFVRGTGAPDWKCDIKHSLKLATRRDAEYTCQRQYGRDLPGTNLIVEKHNMSELQVSIGFQPDKNKPTLTNDGHEFVITPGENIVPTDEIKNKGSFRNFIRRLEDLEYKTDDVRNRVWKDLVSFVDWKSAIEEKLDNLNWGHGKRLFDLEKFRKRIERPPFVIPENDKENSE